MVGLAPARGPRQRKVFNLEVKHCKNRAKTRILDTPFEAKQGKERAQIGSKMRSGTIAVQLRYNCGTIELGKKNEQWFFAARGAGGGRSGAASAEGLFKREERQNF